MEFPALCCVSRESIDAYARALLFEKLKYLFKSNQLMHFLPKSDI